MPYWLKHLVAIVACAVVTMGTAMAWPNRTFQSGDISLAPIRSRLIHESEVPVLLPTYLPHDDETTIGTPEEATAFPILTVYHDGYKIMLYLDPDCAAAGGAGDCYFGSIGAFRGSWGDVKNLGSARRVTLEHGQEGFFFESDCTGAHCGDSVLLWNRDGVIYSISEKSGNEEELKKSANSAIRRGSCH